MGCSLRRSLRRPWRSRRSRRSNRRTRRRRRRPIVIGWAFDSKGRWRRSTARPSPPRRSASSRSTRRAASTADKFGSTPATRRTTTLPARSRVRGACSAQGATSSSRPATSTSRHRSSQEAINRGVLAISTVHRHRPDGAEALRQGKGRLAFSFGNVAQDEGSAMAEYAYERGWRTAGLGTNTLLVYFKNVVQAFDKRFTQLGGRVVGARELRDGREQRPDRGQPAEPARGGRVRHLDGVRRAAGVRLGASARSGTRRRSSTRGPATARTG